MRKNTRELFCCLSVNTKNTKHDDLLCLHHDSVRTIGADVAHSNNNNNNNNNNNICR